MSSVNQTIQRAAMAAETATARQRPTQQKDVLKNVAKSVAKEGSNHVPPVHEEQSKEMKAKEAQVKEAQAKKIQMPKAPLTESETAQGDMLMQEIQDLMVKGYDGKLTFERDFVSEGLEMLNSIQN